VDILVVIQHLVTETSFKDQCVYCGNNLTENDWVSEWIGNMHYKTTTCDCAHKVTVHVSHMGSGHDNWDKKLNPLLNELKNESTKSKIRTIDNIVARIVKNG
jgi:hypothetical protein